jgi:death on curing protein
MTVWLTIGDVQAFNEHFVGPDMLRDFGLLESAVLRPQATTFGDDAYPTLHEKAAALLHSLARNHPFVDGNKRTARAATTVFC